MSLYTLKEAEKIYNCIKRGLHNTYTLALHEVESDIGLMDMFHPPLSGNSDDNVRYRVLSVFRGQLIAAPEDEKYLRDKYSSIVYLYRKRVSKISDFPKIKEWKITNDRW